MTDRFVLALVATLSCIPGAVLAQTKTMPHPITGAPAITDAPGRGEIDSR